MRYTALRTGQVCGVIEDLALFIHIVQLGCKFQSLLGLYALYPTDTPCGPTSAGHTSHAIA